MYDKTVRRRRALLALLVVLSLILLSAYFGEAPGGALHSLQRGFLTVVSPVQDGANKALKPVRDLFGWFGSTLDAKSENKSLREQLAHVRLELAKRQEEHQSYGELIKLYHLDSALAVSDYRPVTANVVYKSPNVWYSAVTIDEGYADGVRINDPVIDGEGLVGKVTDVASGVARVSLITDSAVEVTAKIAATGEVGELQPEVGEPGVLLLQYLPLTATVSRGDLVVTSGTVSSKGDSLYPKGIPIGEVTSVNEQTAFRSVKVSPLADLGNLGVVQVLTSVPGSRAATLSTAVASLTPARPAGVEEEEETGARVASAGSGG